MGLFDFLSKDKANAKGGSTPARSGGAPRSASRAPMPRGGGTGFASFPFDTFFNSLEIGNPIIISSNEDMGMKYESLMMGLEIEGNMIDSKKNIIHDDKGDFSIKVNDKFLRVQTDKAKQFSIIIPDTSQSGGGGPAVGLSLDVGRKIYLKDPMLKTAPILETVVERTYTVDKGNYTNLPAVELRPIQFLNSNTDSRRTVRVEAKIPVKIQIPGETDKRLHTAIIADFNETGVKVGYSEGMTSLASLCKNATIGIYITKTTGPDGGPPEVMRYKGTVIWNKKNDSFGVRLGHIYKEKRFQPMQPIDGIILKGFLLNHPLCNS